MLVVLGFNLLGDGLRDALDPAARVRRGVHLNCPEAAWSSSRLKRPLGLSPVEPRRSCARVCPPRDRDPRWP
ncbi:MAG: hypothetical protein DMD83_26140 [Candidatus Rokuibacteriota bacterium]|nr:MAG: hypothetical protein DMD83_26140 [Candidatus Rokubacteria bacterium]